MFHYFSIFIPFFFWFIHGNGDYSIHLHHEPTFLPSTCCLQVLIGLVSQVLLARNSVKSQRPAGDRGQDIGPVSNQQVKTLAKYKSNDGCKRKVAKQVVLLFLANPGIELIFVHDLCG